MMRDPRRDHRAEMDRFDRQFDKTQKFVWSMAVVFALLTFILVAAVIGAGVVVGYRLLFG